MFWDQEVPPGQDWDTWIRGHLERTRCVVVFWSKTSISSHNVRHEANRAFEQGKLIPALIDSLKSEEFPLGHYTIQGANLNSWHGNVNDPEWCKLLSAIELKAPAIDAQKMGERLKASIAEVANLKVARRKSRWLLGLLVTGIIVAAGSVTAFVDNGIAGLLALTKYRPIDECSPVAEGPYSSGVVSYDFCARGVGKITTEWSKLSEFKGKLGNELLSKLENDKNSTCYIINMSPYGLARSGKMTPLVTRAYERNIDVRWAFQSSDDAAKNRTLQYQWLWLYSGEKEIDCRITKKALCEGVGKFATDAAAIAYESRPKASFPTDARWNTYYSDGTSFYFALLSVPGRMEDHLQSIERGEKVPAGTFGYVAPYSHFPQYDVRPAFYFDGSHGSTTGQSPIDTIDTTLLHYYFRSTVLYFSEGMKPGRYLREAPDPRTSAAVIGTVCADKSIPDYRDEETRKKCEKR